MLYVKKTFFGLLVVGLLMGMFLTVPAEASGKGRVRGKSRPRTRVVEILIGKKPDPRIGRVWMYFGPDQGAGNFSQGVYLERSDVYPVLFDVRYLPNKRHRIFVGASDRDGRYLGGIEQVVMVKKGQRRLRFEPDFHFYQTKRVVILASPAWWDSYSAPTAEYIRQQYGDLPEDQVLVLSGAGHTRQAVKEAFRSLDIRFPSTVWILGGLYSLYPGGYGEIHTSDGAINTSEMSEWLGAIGVGQTIIFDGDNNAASVIPTLSAPNRIIIAPGNGGVGYPVWDNLNARRLVFASHLVELRAQGSTPIGEAVGVATDLTLKYILESPYAQYPIFVDPKITVDDPLGLRWYRSF